MSLVPLVIRHDDMMDNISILFHIAILDPMSGAMQAGMTAVDKRHGGGDPLSRAISLKKSIDTVSVPRYVVLLLVFSVIVYPTTR